jgi:hypothetical protein
MRYFADVGPQAGPFLYRDVTGAIDVLGVRHSGRPVGVAVCVGEGPSGVALWRLVIRGSVRRGKWMLVHRQFRLAQ